MASIQMALVWLLFIIYVPSECVGERTEHRMAPEIVVAFAARNKAHVLPYFLSSLSAINHPKNTISLWITSDNNVDNTVEILETWLSVEKDKYHSVKSSIDEFSSGFPDEKSQFDWSELRKDHIIAIKENALQYARKVGALYIWFLDTDIILSEKNILHYLMNAQKMVIAPMFITSTSNSNFWYEMDENYNFRETEHDILIRTYESTGLHKVALVQTAVLIDLDYIKTDNLTFDPKKLNESNCPNSDLISFALSCKENDVFVYVANNRHYGYMPDPLNDIEKEKDEIYDFELDSLTYNREVEIMPSLKDFLPKKEIDNMGFDQIYVINLKKRQNRRQTALKVYEKLGFKVKIIEAVDGNELTPSQLEYSNIYELSGYLDPFLNRKMTYGEYGCSMSHYNIWQDIVESGHKRVMIFEDDAKFNGNFRQTLSYALEEAEAVNLNWDLLFLARVNLTSNEPFWPGTSTLLNISYSYITTGYALTYNGAKKLIEANPLSKIIPVDEYLPIMYNRHPRKDWSSHYKNHNLIAVGIYPQNVYQSHANNDFGYISDTEDSNIVNNEEYQSHYLLGDPGYITDEKLVKKTNFVESNAHDMFGDIGDIPKKVSASGLGAEEL